MFPWCAHRFIWSQTRNALWTNLKWYVVKPISLDELYYWWHKVVKMLIKSERGRVQNVMPSSFKISQSYLEQILLCEERAGSALDIINGLFSWVVPKEFISPSFGFPSSLCGLYSLRFIFFPLAMDCWALKGQLVYAEKQKKLQLYLAITKTLEIGKLLHRKTLSLHRHCETLGVFVRCII